MTKIIKPVESVGATGALREAIESHRSMMDKLYAMTPEEFNRFLGEHFKRLCQRPLPDTAGNGK